jgi:hypothetical protein
VFKQRRYVPLTYFHSASGAVQAAQCHFQTSVLSRVIPEVFTQRRHVHFTFLSQCKRRSAIFKEPWVEDAVLMNCVYLSGKERAQRAHNQHMGVM